MKTAIRQAIEIVQAKIDSIEESKEGRDTLFKLAADEVILALFEAQLKLVKLRTVEEEQLKDAYADGLNAHRTDFCNRDEYYTKKFIENKWL